MYIHLKLLFLSLIIRIDMFPLPSLRKNDFQAILTISTYFACLTFISFGGHWTTIFFECKRFYCRIDCNLNLHSKLTVLTVFPLQAGVKCHHRQGSRVSGTGPHHQQDPAGADVSFVPKDTLDLLPSGSEEH